MNFFGEMESIIKGNGKMEKNTEVAIGSQVRETATWVNGKMDR